ncbi:MAG: nicotinate-nucleotide--dimethylbenzimidazole phosphoribosyltransferase [Sphingomonas sp.]
MNSFATAADFTLALSSLCGPNQKAAEAASARQALLTKPAGSLGRLEEVAIFLAGWQGLTVPSLNRTVALVFAGNHGVTAHGVSAFPPVVTIEMVRNFERGGAAINALTAAAGMNLKVIPLELDNPTRDFTVEAAMSEDECLSALNAGATLVESNIDLLALGEMGIGNSTAAAALCLRSYGGIAADWVGPGTGIDAAGIERKTRVVEAGIALHAAAPIDPFETLRRVGGREIAAIAGAVVRARSLRIPVVLDGFISCSAVAPLAAAFPAIVDHCIAGHLSTELGHSRLLDRLGLTPLLSLGMRLGEASGAAVAMSVIRAAVAAHASMATFAEAGVSEGKST